MKRLLALAAPAALLLAAACDRDPTEPPAPIASVALAPDERTLAVGETMQLVATVRDTRGGEPAEPDLRWSSDAPGVAAVDGGGVVRGLAPGTATLRAAVGDRSAAVRVFVAAAPPGCDQPGAVRALAVGEAVVAGGVGASVLCLDGGAGGKEYVAVPFNSADDFGRLPLAVSTAGTVPVSPVSPSRVPAFDLGGEGEPVPDGGWEARLRGRAERELERFVGAARALAAAREGGGTALAPRLDLATRNVQPGDQLRINASVASCDTPSVRTGRVVAVTERAVLVADAANPAGGLSDADYQALGAAFDTLAWPVDVAAFGAPGDVDGNGRVVVFFTRAVNELTERGAGGFVAGFFHPRDLFPTRDREGLDACRSSNYAEILYMMATDPAGQVNGNVRARDFVLRTSPGTLAHELQHLISASRRLYELETPFWNEVAWLNEGLSHVAEELAFYRAAGLGPRQRLTSAALAAPRTRAALLSYQSANLQRYARFLADPETETPLGKFANDDALETRGAAWAFLRYAADRRGGDETAFWKSLVESSSVGLANLHAALGADPRLWMRDWMASVFADGVVPGLDARYTMPSWDFRSVLAPLPLWTRPLDVNGATGFTLSGGSGAFVRFAVAAAGVGTLRVGSGAAAPPSQAFVTVIRTK
ncbi:MAG TPA: Ig-like domain-containing protein [Longimicrobium sp.]|jgi:hypothetical protein